MGFIIGTFSPLRTLLARELSAGLMPRAQRVRSGSATQIDGDAAEAPTEYAVLTGTRARVRGEHRTLKAA